MDELKQVAVLELQLITNKYQARFLNELLWQHYDYYREIVKYANHQIKYLRRNRDYQRLIKLKRAWKLKRTKQPTKANKKIVNDRLKVIMQAYGLDSDQGSKQRHSIGFSGFVKRHVNPRFKGLMSVAMQAITTDVWQGIDKVLYQGSKQLHIKRFAQFTIRSKQWNTQFSMDLNHRIFHFKRGKHRFKTARYRAYEREVLFSEYRQLKYIRLIQIAGNTHTKYAIQITYGGLPPRKRRTTRASSPVGIDIGPSTFAYYHHDKMNLSVLNPFFGDDTSKIKQLQHQMTHSQVENNPDAFELTANGKLKYIKGHKVRRTNNYKKLRRKLNYLYRLKSNHRKYYFETLSNELVALSHDIRMEKVSVAGWQAGLFGSSITNQAPSQLMAIIKRKLALFGYEPVLINTVKAKLSQYQHDTKQYHQANSDLDHRAKKINMDGTEYNAQRDVYSAFLATKVLDDCTIPDISNDEFRHFLINQEQMVDRIKAEDNMILESMGISYHYAIS